MENKKKIEFAELYRLCNREQFFTSGDNKQYEKMFDIAKDGVTKMELAYILYICSTQTLNTIFELITPLFKEAEDGRN